MGYRPPKGVRPPQLEGKRSGRPKGVRNHAKAWADVLWAYRHRDREDATPPSAGARLWHFFASIYPDEIESFLEDAGQL
jgi:hypothetical protein